MCQWLHPFKTSKNSSKQLRQCAIIDLWDYPITFAYFPVPIRLHCVFCLAACPYSASLGQYSACLQHRGRSIADLLASRDTLLHSFTLQHTTMCISHSKKCPVIVHSISTTEHSEFCSLSDS